MQKKIIPTEKADITEQLYMIFCSSELASWLRTCVLSSAGEERPRAVSMEAEGRGGKRRPQVVTSL